MLGSSLPPVIFSNILNKHYLENIEEALKIGQPRKTAKIGYTRRRKENKKKNTTQYALDTNIHQQT
jgi:hypothetical protein